MNTKQQSILDQYPDYEVTIGIEVHIQVKTKSKLFCGCANSFGATPNSNICPICCGYPGTLPVLNRKVIDAAIKAGLATNCRIAKQSIFARKHYMYPDLPKNFQTTQDDRPICFNGYVPIEAMGSVKNIRIMRIHIEEDAGKNIHAHTKNSFVDLNRAGTPLLEIVTEPDIASADEAKAYLMRLRTIAQYLGVSDANMEEGSFRADTNISVKKKDASKLGTRVELKNINSFKFIHQAINYEVKRQIELIEDGGSVIQETRGWNERKQISFSMRSKEEAQDYRYFVEPDLPPSLINDDWLTQAKNDLPELPHEKLDRFQKEYDLSPYEAQNLVEDAAIAAFFEAIVKHCKKPKLTSNWVLRDLLGYLSDKKISLQESTITPEKFAELIEVLDKKIINSNVGQAVFLEMAETGKYPSIIIQEKDLEQISSADELASIIQQVIDENPQTIAKYKADQNKRLLGYLVGQAMKATKGKGNPKLITELLEKKLMQ